MIQTLRTPNFILIIAACCLVSCGKPPQNLEHACSILLEKPKYKKAFKDTNNKWGVPVHVQMAIMHQESSFRSNAKTPRKYFLGIIPNGRQSSAYGFAQALDGTWNEYKMSTGRFAARRNNIRDATDFMGWFMSESKRRNGISLSDAKRQYLAYHEGHTGYARKSFRKKAWLMAVADKVANRASMYKKQLNTCQRG